MLVPFSSQKGPGPIFEASYRKSGCSRNVTFLFTFWPKWIPRWGQDRPKIVPRRVQDRLGSYFVRLDCSLRFLIFLDRFLTVLGSQMEPRGGRLHCANRPAGGPRRSWVGPFFVLRFGFAFLSLLSHSWGRFGSLLVYFSGILGSLGPVLGRLGLVLGHSGWHV